MSTPTRWIAKDGTPGYLIVTGTHGKYLKVEVYDSTGALLSRELKSRAPAGRSNSEPGPVGYRREAPPTPSTRTVHDWGRTVELERGTFGNRCKACHRERRTVDSSGRSEYRVPGGVWEFPARTPPCGARAE